jgi:hypothetical protein
VHVYREPTDPTRPPRNLIKAFMDLAPSLKQSPEENQLTECVAWLVARSPAFARAFCQLFLSGSQRDKKALELATRFAVDTRVTLPHPAGRGVLFPDLLICGNARSFELLVEVKAGSTPHSYPDGDEVLLQPDMYAKAWRALPPTTQADERFVGTLTNGFAFPDSGDPIRVADVTWDQLREQLARMLNGRELENDVRLVAEDLLAAIEERVLATAGELPPHTDVFLAAARPVIDEVALRLAGLLPSGKVRRPARIEEDYTGRYVEFMAPEGTTFELWLFATVTGGQYNLFGLGDVAVARITALGASYDPARLLSAGFQKRTTLSGWADWRIWLPLDHADGVIGDPHELVDAFVGTVLTVLSNSNPTLLEPAEASTPTQG